MIDKRYIRDVKKAYYELIEGKGWLDMITRLRALRKLNTMKELVGYPDWVLNNHELDNFYQIKSFEAMVYMQRNSVLRNIRSIGQPVDITREQMARLTHRIFPATILKPPFLYSNSPAAINYGTIGWLDSYVISYLGLKYDSKGNRNVWFTIYSEVTYHEKANCFVQQYSSEYVPEVHMNLNGRNTLGENIADNGGLRESFRAFQTY
ncbi:unnamed protein product, partial [Oppiella nova]